MGTNYYVKDKKETLNEKQLKKVANETVAELNTLGYTELYRVTDFIMSLAKDDRLHIGKNSFGWRFAFASDNFQGLEDFKKTFNPETHVIEDEYEREITLELFCKIVRDTLQWDGDDSGFKYCINDEGYRLLSGEFS